MKIPAKWTPPTSGTVTTPNSGVQRYLQDGITARKEQNGTLRFLQPNLVVGKKAITWASQLVTQLSAGVVRKLQNGTIRLLQDGLTQRILQPTAPEPKLSSIKWTPQPSGTVSSPNTGIIRKLQNGTVRLLQDGVTQRILQPNVVTGKTPVTWSNL